MSDRSNNCSVTSAISADATLTLRPDLQQQRIRMGREYYWVLKDPLSRAYFYFTDREFTILSLLDGRRSVLDVARECAKKFASEYVRPEFIAHFLSDARDKGLVNAPHCGQQLAPVPKRSALANPLAIRVPGFNPNTLLQPFAKWIRPLLTRGFALLWLIVIGFAVMIVITNFEAFAGHLAAAHARGGQSWWGILLVTIALTKIAHELGHALFCKAQGR